jgi:hypothetical protein
MSEREKTESRKFWLRLKKEAVWTIWRKGQDETLVIEIEFWVTKIDQYLSWTIPTMFRNASQADIAMHVMDASGSFSATNIKGQIMMERTEVGVSTGIATTFQVDIQTIRFVDEERISAGVGRRGVAPRRRRWAYFGLSTAIVEFKARVETQGDQFRHEMDKLVGALRIASQKTETFHVMVCEGWYQGVDHHGLIYRPPPIGNPSQCQSLGDILRKGEYNALLQTDLENRVVLAKALVWTLFELHSVDWVHKSIHPDNILLFSDDARAYFDWSCPYIVGFDTSRSSDGISDGVHTRKNGATRLYINPDRQGREYTRYLKTHDIYSLGVVLLEIGRLRSFADDPRYDDMTPHELKDFYVRKARSLKIVLGKAFSEVVLTCLSGEFDTEDDSQLLGQFLFGICEKLDQIKLS